MTDLIPDIDLGPDIDTLRRLHTEQRVPDKAHISKLPKPTKRDNQKGKCKECGGWHGLPAVHLDYMGHAEVTDVLLEADPTWTWEPFATDEMGLPLVIQKGGDVVLWIRLTVCGVTRPGVGTAPANKEGDGLKELIGDALRNAAMRFGIATSLWSKAEGVEREAETAEPEPEPEPPEGSLLMADAIAGIKTRLTETWPNASEVWIKETGNAIWKDAGSKDKLVQIGRAKYLPATEVAVLDEVCADTIRTLLEEAKSA